jgi:hypothetical protein
VNVETENLGPALVGPGSARVKDDGSVCIDTPLGIDQKSTTATLAVIPRRIGPGRRRGRGRTFLPFLFPSSRGQRRFWMTSSVAPLGQSWACDKPSGVHSLPSGSAPGVGVPGKHNTPKSGNRGLFAKGGRSFQARARAHTRTCHCRELGSALGRVVVREREMGGGTGL